MGKVQSKGVTILAFHSVLKWIFSSASQLTSADYLQILKPEINTVPLGRREMCRTIINSLAL